jgi:hypothetical protein
MPSGHLPANISRALGFLLNHKTVAAITSVNDVTLLPAMYLEYFSISTGYSFLAEPFCTT